MHSLCAVFFVYFSLLLVMSHERRALDMVPPLARATP
jgi:hypothetical protein